MTNRTEILAATSRFVRTASELENRTKYLGWIDEANTVDWQRAMKRSVRDSRLLRDLLGLPPASDDNQTFPTFVPLEFLKRIKLGDRHDPLLRQVLPVGLENDPSRSESFVADPVGDLDSRVAPGLLQKYHGRALVVSTVACGIHCRYCFRREFRYSDNRMVDSDRMMDYLRDHPSIEEVILSGGDPLTLRDDHLGALIDRLESIDHVKRLRFHTRMPVVIPNRITTALVSHLKASRFSVWFVIHVNHAREWDSHVAKQVSKLIDSGIPVLNQAVLLQGVNDELESLVELSRVLINDRVTPYYLHQLDRVRGAAHFEVTIDRGRELINQMRKRLPGYAVPQYVTEQPGELSKKPL